MTFQIKFPAPQTPFVDPRSGIITQAWQYFLLQLYQRTGGPSGSAPAFFPVTLTGSPFSYTAAAVGSVLISGGTVSAVSLIRNGIPMPVQTSGFIPVSIGDIVQITYSAPPTVTFVGT